MASNNGLTMTVLGCGTMGIAILNGILTSLGELKANGTAPSTETPASLPSEFIACVRSQRSADRIIKTLGDNASGVNVVRNDNVASVKKADVVLLACKPYMVKGVLGEAGIADALKGKLLISVCAGITVEDMETALYGEVPKQSPTEDGRCRCVRAMFNTAALIRESMTVIGISDPPLSDESEKLITWIFKQIGDVVYLPPNNMDASTALAGSGPAMFALMLEAAIDGGVAMGLPRAEAQRIAAQTMRGVTGLVQSGEHPAILREKVCTPGGCTIGGLLVLEEGGVRGAVSRAVREATTVASQLGKGVQGVNGTRHN
ncbi:Putative Pyrroline-5-carboxylate reductase [[Torrubiella] hemipterigena]|uniref:Pyrroline-5-carboxylate reductase n=2 Tax=[Torrubiella] hemipterigena TaxID=1531966 RepID=A0A0A1TIC6_9HYPO|nr:Putative Pyrroline-5-carboxylate reductase [[Torrubiella] hemipterigena]